MEKLRVALEWWYSLPIDAKDAYCLDYCLGKTPFNMSEEDIVELYWRR